MTGGGDRPYALGLLSCLLSKDIHVDFIGSDELFDRNLMNHPKVFFLNLRGDQRPDASRWNKIIRVAKYYRKLIEYAYKTDSGLFHIIWLNKFIYFDRVVMNYYYKVLGKKIVHTAHNIDQQERDGKSDILNRFTLRIMYNLLDHIFVHTKKMKGQLVEQFGVDEKKISVIPFGINDTIPTTHLTKIQARQKLEIRDGEKVLLFFGNIAPYKGLEYLVLAMPILKEKLGHIKLIIAGRVKNCNSYWEKNQEMIVKNKLEDCVLARTEFIPDEDVEIYFKAADALILPYRSIYQSGVLFLSYNFGLPVIATDVGSLREDIIEGETGYLCPPEDPNSLALSIINYYESRLYKEIETNKYKIKNFAKEKYSWSKIGDITISAYNMYV
ncbi:glycosyltransferase family 4 protein [bacterium]|nr:glycosyltransferase family 4 protein [bacterium]